MSKSGMLVVGCICLFLTLPAPATTHAQAVIQRVGPGSTVDGDQARGMGVFLQGAAWYELNAAKANELNTRAMIGLEKWNQQVYAAYQQEQASRIAQQRNLTKAQAEKAARDRAAREEQLRTSPTSDQVVKGEALNALLIDLSDPKITETSWRLAKVDLPPGVGIKPLVFRFAPKPGAKGNQELSRGVIALARLDTEGRWPGVLEGKALAPERLNYEAAYRAVRDESLAGKLSLDSILRMDGAIEALKAKAKTSVPTERGFRDVAIRFVGDLAQATSFFDADTMDYAREIINDTQRHEAGTVGELLAFMRKYRLMFASAEKSPNGGEMYRTLYGLMGKQKEKLGMRDVVATRPVKGRPTDKFVPGSAWGGTGVVTNDRGSRREYGVTFTITEVEGKSFKGRETQTSGLNIREFAGEINAETGQFVFRFTRTVKGFQIDEPVKGKVDGDFMDYECIWDSKGVKNTARGRLKLESAP